MTDNIDASETRVEGQPREYSPDHDPGMRRVILTGSSRFADGREIVLESRGYMTDVAGVKIPLERLHNYNAAAEGRKTSNSYREGYFQTHSGTIYQFADRGDRWVIESAKDPRQFEVSGAAIIEVGTRFVSPKMVNGQPDLNTSPVQRVVLSETSVSSGIVKKYGLPYSQEKTDLPKTYHQQKDALGSPARPTQ